MKKFYVIVFSFFILAGLFVVSCKKETSLLSQNNTKDINSIELYPIANQVYNKISDYVKSNNIIPVNLDSFFPDAELSKDEKSKITKFIKAKSYLFADGGVNVLLDELNKKQKVSQKVKSYFYELNGSLRVKEDKKEDSYNEIDSVISRIEKKISNDILLSSNDSELLLNCFQVTRGAYKYLVEKRDINDLSANSNLQTRGGCRGLVIAGVSVGAGLIVASLILEEVIKVSAATGQWYVAGAAALTLAVGYLLCNVFCVFGGCESVQCDLVTGVPQPVLPRTCNTTNIVLYGGKDIVKWQWRLINGNGSFDNFETTTPSNVFRSSGSSLSSDIKVTAICSDGSKQETFNNFTFANEINGTRPVSIVDGPRSGMRFQSLRFSASQSSQDNFKLSWEVSPSGGGITPSDSYWATASFYNTGTYIVKAKMTNLCTGEVSESTQQITIN